MVFFGAGIFPVKNLENTVFPLPEAHIKIVKSPLYNEKLNLSNKYA
jgi:hypothetical protein